MSSMALFCSATDAFKLDSVDVGTSNLRSGTRLSSWEVHMGTWWWWWEVWPEREGVVVEREREPVVVVEVEGVVVVETVE